MGDLYCLRPIHCTRSHGGFAIVGFYVMFWRNWLYRRNGLSCNLEFFANNYEHAEKTLNAAIVELNRTLSISPDVSIIPDRESGGYIATIYCQLWLVRQRHRTAHTAPS